VSATTRIGTGANRPVIHHRLYAGVTIGTALITFLGFAESYYLKFLFGTPPLRLLLHVHGIVMTAWLVLFAVQVRLVATRRLDVHRRLGLLGVVLAGLVVVVGVPVALSQGHLHLLKHDMPIEPALVLLPVTLGALLLFATCVTTAVLFEDARRTTSGSWRCHLDREKYRELATHCRMDAEMIGNGSSKSSQNGSRISAPTATNHAARLRPKITRFGATRRIASEHHCKGVECVRVRKRSAQRPRSATPSEGRSSRRRPGGPCAPGDAR